MISDHDLAEKMTLARLEANLTQAELAVLMFTTQSTVARWETGGRIPGIATLDKLAEVTGKRLVVEIV